MVSEISQIDGIDFSDPAKLETYQQKLVAGLVLLVCYIVPIWAYEADMNLPVVERLRLTE